MNQSNITPIILKISKLENEGDIDFIYSKSNHKYRY